MNADTMSRRGKNESDQSTRRWCVLVLYICILGGGFDHLISTCTLIKGIEREEDTSSTIQLPVYSPPVLGGYLYGERDRDV